VPSRPAAPRSARLPRVQRRAQLLDAARAVFVTSGYHAASMDDIAESAGVSKPVLYQHFTSKLELYLALVDQGADELTTRVREALGSTTANKQRAAATMEAFFAFIDDASGFHRLLFESDARGEPEVTERVNAVLADCAVEVSHVVEEDTGLPPDEAMLLSIGMVGAAQVSARYWLENQGPVDRSRAAELMSTLTWRGIRGFPMADEGSSDHGTTLD